MLPSAVSYFDGFFAFPTQVLARAVPSEGSGASVAFAEGQQLGAYASFDDLSKLTPDVTRQLLITGGFLNDLASKADPKAFVYAFDGDGISQRAAAPAAAQFGRGMGVHQRQQR